MLKGNRLDFRGGALYLLVGFQMKLSLQLAVRLKFRSVLRSRLAGLGDASS